MQRRTAAEDAQRLSLSPISAFPGMSRAVAKPVPAAVPMAVKSRWSASVRKKPPALRGAFSFKRPRKISVRDLHDVHDQLSTLSALQSFSSVLTSCQDCLFAGGDLNPKACDSRNTGMRLGHGVQLMSTPAEGLVATALSCSSWALRSDQCHATIWQEQMHTVFRLVSASWTPVTMQPRTSKVESSNRLRGGHALGSQ